MPKVNHVTQYLQIDGIGCVLYFLSIFFNLLAMGDNGEEIRGRDEQGDRPGGRRGWLAGFMWGVGVGGAVAMVLVALSRSPRCMELVGRYRADGTWEVVYRWWGQTG
jgi:hypothetical protein